MIKLENNYFTFEKDKGMYSYTKHIEQQQQQRTKRKKVECNIGSTKMINFLIGPGHTFEETKEKLIKVY
jgi:hypothetical protein